MREWMTKLGLHHMIYLSYTKTFLFSIFLCIMLSNSDDSIQTQSVVRNIIMYNVNMFIQMHRMNGTYCESTQRQVMKIGFN